MTTGLEREIKLRYRTAAEARRAILAAGATPLRGRRIQRDTLLDFEDRYLRGRRSVLRLRAEGDDCRLTYKGPPLPSEMKVREELETSVGDGAVALEVLGRLGLRPWFRYEKYREEFQVGDVTVALDETPVGTYVELEGSEAGISQLASTLGRDPAEYIVESYRALFLAHCAATGKAPTDMTFDEP